MKQVSELISEAKRLGKALGDFNEDTQVFILDCIDVFEDNGDSTALSTLMQSLHKNSHAFKLIPTYLKKYTPLRWNDEKAVFKKVKDKTVVVNHDGLESEPWYETENLSVDVAVNQAKRILSALTCDEKALEDGKEVVNQLSEADKQAIAAILANYSTDAPKKDTNE